MLRATLGVTWTRFTSLAVIASFPCTAPHAQTDSATLQLRADVFRQQLEASYITFGRGFGSSLDSLHFEANISPHFTLGARSRFKAVVTPKVLLRMRSDESSPVLAPSFMPRISAYWAFKEPSSSTPTALLGMLRISHHSNGQRGPFRNPGGTLNDTTGSFSTNFIEAGVIYGSRGEARGEVSNASLGLSFEWHPGSLVDSELRPIYSRYRTNFHAVAPIWGVPYNVFRLTHLGGRQQGIDDWYEHLAFTYSLGFKNQWLRGSDFAFLLTAYQGPDPYNMRFPNRITVVRFGIVRGENTRDDGSRAPW